MDRNCIQNWLFWPKHNTFRHHWCYYCQLFRPRCQIFESKYQILVKYDPNTVFVFDFDRFFEQQWLLIQTSNFTFQCDFRNLQIDANHPTRSQICKYTLEIQQMCPKYSLYLIWTNLSNVNNFWSRIITKISSCHNNIHSPGIGAQKLVWIFHGDFR